MNLRWHLLLVLVAVAAALGVAAWLSSPVWATNDYESVRYAGMNVERLELVSLTSEGKQSAWFMEVHDWRSGALVRKLPLDIPELESHNHFLDVPAEGDGVDAPLLFTQHLPGQSTRCYLLDGVTGKRLQNAPILEWCLNGRLARHKNQLALALKSEVRYFRDKTDPGRSMALAGARKVAFSPDGASLACVGSDELLYLIDLPSGEVSIPEGISGNIFDVSYLSNGQLLIIATRTVPGSVSQAGVNVTRWQREGSTLRQVGLTALLRRDEKMGLPIPVRFQEGEHDSLNIKVFTGQGWLDRLEYVFNWLAHWGIPIEKAYPKKQYTHCFKLDASNDESASYKEWYAGRLDLDSNTEVSYEPEWHQAKSIAVYSKQRVWPWAVAMGVVVYAGLWRAMRGRKLVVSC